MIEQRLDQHKIFNNLTGLILALALLIPELVFAFDTTHYLAAKQPPFLQHHNQTISLPRSLGKITNTHQASERGLIIIQDLHCHDEVQHYIAKIIKYMNDRHGVSLIGQEGASGKLDLSQIDDFPITSIKQAVTDYYVQQGKLTGAEYQAINSDRPLTLVGLEDPALYDSSLHQVCSFLNNESQGLIADLRERMENVKDQLYNKKLMSFDRVYQDYRQGQLNILVLARHLQSWARQVGLDLDSFQHFQHLVRHEEGYEIEALLAEVDSITGLIRQRLYTDQRQRHVDQLCQRIDIMEKLLNISATQKELDEFRRYPNQYTIQPFVNFIQQQPAQQELAVTPELFQLDRYLSQVTTFYRLADQRSQAFADNMLAAMTRHQQELGVMITGGFHTDLVERALKSRDISYLVIKPRLTKMDSLNPYFALIQGQDLPIEQLLAKTQTNLAVRSWLQTPLGANQVLPMSFVAQAQQHYQSLTSKQQQAVQNWFGQRWQLVKIGINYRVSQLKLAGQQQLALLTANAGQFTAQTRRLIEKQGGRILQLLDEEIGVLTDWSTRHLDAVVASFDSSPRSDPYQWWRSVAALFGSVATDYSLSLLPGGDSLLLGNPSAMAVTVAALAMMTILGSMVRDQLIRPFAGIALFEGAGASTQEEPSPSSGSGPAGYFEPDFEERTRQFEQAMRAQLFSFYGQQTPVLVEHLIKLVRHFRENLTAEQWEKLKTPRRFTQQDIMTMVYGNGFLDPTGKLKPLQVLHKMAKKLKLGIIHLAPFYPSDVDYGYSPLDMKKVSPDLGTWADIRKLSKIADLMFDFSALHGSGDGDWVQKALIADYLDQEDPRYRDYQDYKDFVKIYDELPPIEWDLRFIRPRLGRPFTSYYVVEAKVTRPNGQQEKTLQAFYGEPQQNGEPFNYVMVKHPLTNAWTLVRDIPSEQATIQAAGVNVIRQVSITNTSQVKYVYTTFTRPERSDNTVDTRQTDWNYDNPAVFQALTDVILFYISNGASLIRFDAVGYIIKRRDSQAMHLAEVHQLLQAFEMVLNYAAPGVTTVGEVNEKLESIKSYVNRDNRPEVGKVYNFAPYTLALHAINNGVTNHFKALIKDIGIMVNRQVVNLAGCHDGVPFKATYGYLVEELRERFSQLLSQTHGAKPKAAQAPGEPGQAPKTYTYEVCTTADSALNLKQDPLDQQIKRHIVLYAMNQGFRGLPADYYVSLVGGENYAKQYEAGEERDINRERFDYRRVLRALRYPKSLFGRSIEGLVDWLPLISQLPLVTSDMVARWQAGLDRFRNKMGLIIQAKHDFYQRRSQQAAFDPNGPPVELLFNENEAILSRLYESPDGMDYIVDVINVSNQAQEVTIQLPEIHRLPNQLVELFEGRQTSISNNQLKLALAPYEVLWLQGRATSSPDTSHQATLNHYANAYRQQAFMVQPTAEDQTQIDQAVTEDDLTAKMRKYLQRYYEDDNKAQGKIGDDEIIVRSPYDQNIEIKLKKSKEDQSKYMYRIYLLKHSAGDIAATGRESALMAEANQEISLADFNISIDDQSDLMIGNIARHGEEAAALLGRYRVADCLYDYFRWTSAARGHKQLIVPALQFPPAVFRLMALYSQDHWAYPDKQERINLAENPRLSLGLGGQALDNQAYMEHLMGMHHDMKALVRTKMEESVDHQIILQWEKLADQVSNRFWETTHDPIKVAMVWSAAMLYQHFQQQSHLEDLMADYASAQGRGQAGQAMIQFKENILQPYFQPFQHVINWDLNKLAELFLLGLEEAAKQPDNIYAKVLQPITTGGRGTSWLWYRLHSRLVRSTISFESYSQRAAWVENTYIWTVAGLVGLITSWLLTGEVTWFFNQLVSTSTWVKAVSLLTWLGLFVSTHWDQQTPRKNRHAALKIYLLIALTHIGPLLLVIPFSYLIHWVINQEQNNRQLTLTKNLERLLSFQPADLKSSDVPANRALSAGQSWWFRLWGELRLPLIALQLLGSRKASGEQSQATVSVADWKKDLIARLANHEPILARGLLQSTITLEVLPQQVSWPGYLIGLWRGTWLQQQAGQVTLFLPAECGQPVQQLNQGQVTARQQALLYQIAAYAGYRHYKNLRQVMAIEKALATQPQLLTALHQQALFNQALQRLAVSFNIAATSHLLSLIMTEARQLQLDDDQLSAVILTMDPKKRSITIEVDQKPVVLPAVFHRQPRGVGAMLRLIRQFYPGKLITINGQPLTQPKRRPPMSWQQAA